jgi:hypothetical protein
MKTYKTILSIGNKNFCAFCGNEILHDNDGQLLCKCEDAKQFRNALHVALQLEMEANKTMNNAPKPRYELRTVCRPISSNTGNTTSDDDEPSVCV